MLGHADSDDRGEPVAEIVGLVGKRLVGAGSCQIDTAYEGCYEYRWVPAARDEGTHGRIRDIIRAVLLADGSGIATELAARFAAEGIETLLIPRGDSRRLTDALADVPLDRRTLIAFAAGLSTGDAAWQGLADYPAVPLLLQLAPTLQKAEGVPRLCLVTNGAAHVTGDQQLDLGQAILHGMTRVVRNEWPRMSLTVIDLSRAMPPNEADALVSELLHTRRDLDESEIALRDGRRYVRQLLPVDRDSAERTVTRRKRGLAAIFAPN